MLTRLHINNYAIIDELDISFNKGLNIITGETGAGKSILMGALNLILGDRADSSVLSDAGVKCVVEGYFKVKENEDLKAFFELHDLDSGDEIVIRREINSNGKSRSFINDTPVNLNQLRALSIFLVDLHQQFDTRELGSESFQRLVLDSLAGNSTLLAKLKEEFARLTSILKELKLLKESAAAAQKDHDYNSFLFDELEGLALKEDELELIDVELKLLNNAESVKLQLGTVFYELKDSDTPLVQQLRVLQQRLTAQSEFHAGIESLRQRLNSLIIELADIADEVEGISDSIQYNAERIQFLTDRLAEGYRLQKKHGVQTTAELIQIRDHLEAKLGALEKNALQIEEFENLKQTAEQEARATANSISAKRSSQVESFTKNVNALLKQVGMPNARIKVQIRESELDAYGLDDIQFLFNANMASKDEDKARFEPMGRVASGGELSRLMLSIKSLVAKKLQLPTLIFDEIDSGISGEAAKQVGVIMKDLSQNHQIISITHQPQIAAKADAHYFVYKETTKNKVSTSIRKLNQSERVDAVAKMLSGEQPTPAAMANAREMVGGI